MRKVLWLRVSVISTLLMVFVFTFAARQAQAYFGFPYSGFSYGGFPYGGFPYDSFPYGGYNLAYNGAGYPYYSAGIGVPSYNSGTLANSGIFGSPYVTAPPPDFSGWTWTSPTEAYSPPFPDGTVQEVFVSWVAGSEGKSPYYQQNYTPSSPGQQNVTLASPPYGGFPYGGYNLAYNGDGYPYYSAGIGVPSYNSGTLGYSGIFGFPYVTAQPPGDFSGWTWTSPTEAYSPPFPDGTSAAVSVDWVAGYEGMSPYYQQNYTPSSPYQQNYTSASPLYDRASWLLQLYASLGVPPFLFPAVLGSDGVDYTPSFLYQALTNPVPPGCYGKPAIYLYPQTDTSVSVKLDIDGEITKTIPPYNNGWHVLATPDGTITDESQGKQCKEYDYLFWEAKPKKLELPDKGWIVACKDLEEWFNEYLPKLGLNKKEKEQFMEYWLERLQGKNYYELKLLDRAFLEEHAKLTISPSPDTLIRIIFCFTPLDEYKADEYKADEHKTNADGHKTLEPPLIKTPDRKGFVALEWGGILNEGK